MNKKNEPLLKFRLQEVLTMTEVYTLSMLMLYTILSIILFPHIKNAEGLILLNLLLGIAVISIATVAVKVNGGRLFKIFRKLYFVPIVFIIYSQVQTYIRVVNPYLYDDILIKLDKMIFGINPTVWLQKFSSPILTEYLQICYFLFYIMPIIHGIELHFKHKEYEFLEFSRNIIFAFYLSYLLYFFLPAVGPRFMVHNFSLMSTDLPGIWLTSFIRESINIGGGIPKGTFLHPELLVNRDCMPSGHTMMTLINIILAFRYRSSFRWVFLIIGTSLIISTVYLRYHYVVDVIAGILCAFISLYLEPRIKNFAAGFGFNAK